MSIRRRARGPDSRRESAAAKSFFQCAWAWARSSSACSGDLRMRPRGLRVIDIDDLVEIAGDERLPGPSWMPAGSQPHRVFHGLAERPGREGRAAR